MYIKSLEITNFRNYNEQSIDFDKNVNMIIGDNAQGKTNLIEAIYFSAFGKSFRTNKDSELIKFNEEFAKIKVESEKDCQEYSLELILSKKSKKYGKINGVKLEKYSQLLDHIYVVSFTPEDLKIVKDEPEKRRRFIDKELCKIKPSYYYNLANYKKVLMQRNAYLKENEIRKDIIDIWDYQLSKYASSIIEERKRFIDKISDISNKINLGITNGKEELKVIYQPNIKIDFKDRDSQEYIYNLLSKNLDNDIRQRTTSHGPHKDDIDFYVNGVSARSFGSQGQQRTVALSLKLAEIDIVKEETRQTPILILDDVMSELDIKRQEFLVKTLSESQIFLTTTEIPDVLKNKFEDIKIFNVKSGKII